MAERVRPHGQDCERAKAKLGPSGYTPSTPATNETLFQDSMADLRAQLTTARERIAALEKALGTIEYWDRADVAKPPTADQGASETCWLIERSIDDGFATRPHWLAWRDRDAISWTPNAHEADRYEWSIAASREARMLAATLGVTCTAVEHQFSPTADQGAP